MAEPDADNTEPEIRRSALMGRKDEASRMMSRLLGSMPAATFEMETFAKLAGIVTNRDIPTAAVECTHRPRLLINPDFVAQYCRRDEHLFLLVMHELWHVILAHTSLYPRVTMAQNIAFDAIINAGLMRQFKKPAYRGFFERLNPPDKFPHLLLRPPVGWPDNPKYPDVGPSGTVRVLRQLYPPPGLRRPTMPFYQEILDLIKQDMRERGLLVDGEPILLGDHDPQNQGGKAYENPYLREAMGRIVKKWPSKPGQYGRPPGMGGDLDDWQLDPYFTAEAPRRAFAHVLRQCLGPNMGQYRRKERLPIPGIAGKSVLPNAKDRLMSARKTLGLPPTLWARQGTIKARVPERRVKAHVYVDVSGSMSDILPYLLNLLTPYVASGKAEVFQFSTEVEHMPIQKLRKGIVRSTGGTQINAVMRHLLQDAVSARRALILTDGYTGKPHRDYVGQLQERNTAIHVVLPAESPYEDDLKGIARSVTVLPPLR